MIRLPAGAFPVRVNGHVAVERTPGGWAMRAGLAFLLLAASASAAPVPPPPSGPDEVSPAAAKLLKLRRVQKELKLTPEQRVVIIDALGDIDENYEKKFNDLLRKPGFPNDQVGDQIEKLDQERQKATEKALTDAAAKTLTPLHRTRLRQIDWQVRGPAAFQDPLVVKALTLTDKQQEKVAALVELIEDKIDAYLDARGDPDEDKKKKDLLAARDQALKDIAAALTADQRAIWKGMLGDPVTGFDVIEQWLALVEEGDLLPPG